MHRLAFLFFHAKKESSVTLVRVLPDDAKLSLCEQSKDGEGKGRGDGGEGGGEGRGGGSKE